ncbi:MAG: hypothetical protein ABIG40_00355 [Parcubacteria group bacterium]
MKEKVYNLLGVPQGNALLLQGVFTERDQEALKGRYWDYDDPQFICRQVVELIEQIPPKELTKKEKFWFNEILWWWHHHAISCAVYYKKDKKRAKEEADIALSLQSLDHPNKITKLLYLLVNDKLQEAEVHTKTIIDEVEKDTARDTIEDYKSSEWPLLKKQVTL